MSQEHESSPQEQTRLTLSEERLVVHVPSVLWGFQLILPFPQHFNELPFVLQAGHLVAFGFTTASMIAMNIAASYQRIAAQGEATERVANIGGKTMLAGMGLMALGVSIDAGVVTHEILQNPLVTAAVSAGTLAATTSAWFAFPWLARR